jgi:hypothetical protein
VVSCDPRIAEVHAIEISPTELAIYRYDMDDVGSSRMELGLGVGKPFVFVYH